MSSGGDRPGGPLSTIGENLRVLVNLLPALPLHEYLRGFRGRIRCAVQPFCRS